MTDDANDWLAERLSPADLSEVLATTVRVSGEEERDLGVLIVGWKRHVEKLEGDMVLPTSDRSVWGAHDLVAAVSLRSFVEIGLKMLSPKVEPRVASIVSLIDERYRSFTEEDEQNRIEKVDGRIDPARGWWWRRIPRAGAAREETLLYSTFYKD